MVSTFVSTNRPFALQHTEPYFDKSEGMFGLNLRRAALCVALGFIVSSPNIYLLLQTNTGSENFSGRISVTAKNDLNAKVGIHFIGERHSGTTWMVRHLEKCFGHSIKVRTFALVKSLSLLNIVLVMLKIPFFIIFILAYEGNSQIVPIQTLVSSG